jgi:hypothetical protein
MIVVVAKVGGYWWRSGEAWILLSSPNYNRQELRNVLIGMSLQSFSGIKSLWH